MSSRMICTPAACTRVSRMTEDCRSPSDSRNGFETNAVFVFCCRDIRPSINCFSATPELNFAGRADVYDMVFSRHPLTGDVGCDRQTDGQELLTHRSTKTFQFLCFLESNHNAMVTICAVLRIVPFTQKE